MSSPIDEFPGFRSNRTFLGDIENDCHENGAGEDQGSELVPNSTMLH
jgi:hypothetical protein